MFSEDDLLPISALQHLLFCERRVALIFIEGLWDENPFTVEGRHLHDRTHEAQTEVRGDLRIARGLRLRSLRLGLSGMADVIEFHRLPDDFQGNNQKEGLPQGVHLEGAEGLWHPFPVEYKRGRLRHEKGYEVQLCAQALCLEEMIQVAVPAGAIYYGKTGRRLEVAFDEKMSMETEKASERLHELIGVGKTPKARYENKCGKCSLLSICMPKAMGSKRSVSCYLDAVIEEAKGGTE